MCQYFILIKTLFVFQFSAHISSLNIPTTCLNFQHVYLEHWDVQEYHLMCLDCLKSVLGLLATTIPRATQKQLTRLEIDELFPRRVRTSGPLPLDVRKVASQPRVQVVFSSLLAPSFLYLKGCSLKLQLRTSKPKTSQNSAKLFSQ